ncbi:uridine kinase [Kitasatospora sp. NPDC018058]|uniref:uridine kinase n=1 Tax=Kitasatospora sp. NPDC018058 TaxID=3364025 RepID=UPI0037C1582D
MLVTLTGGAGAGKTTLAGALAVVAGPGPVRVLHGDDYYFAEPGCGRGVWAPDEGGAPRLDMGDPRSVDEGRLAVDVDAALGEARVVIVDGLFARRVAPQRPCRRFDVFVDLAADLRLVRKIERKCVAGGFPLEVLLRNYVGQRRAAHERHVEPLRRECDLVVDGALAPEVLAGLVWSAAAEKAERGRDS